MKQRAKVYKGKRVVMGDKNRVTKHEIHVNDIPQQGGESGGSNSGGGGNTPKPALTINDATFYDYDGTILYSYTKDEFLRLKEMPPLPTQEGLICQEWNWDFADAKEFVSEFGAIDIGATYITDDGITRLYITIPEGLSRMITLCHSYKEGTVYIDWGDGEQEELQNNKDRTSHTYNQSGDFVISIDSTNGYISFGDGNSGIIYDYNAKETLSFLRKCHIGANVWFGLEWLLGDASGKYGGVRECCYLESITIPNHCNRIAYGCFSACYALKCVVIPKSCTTSYTNMFGYSKVISLPKELVKIKGISAKCVERIILPPNCTLESQMIDSNAKEIIANTFVGTQGNNFLRKLVLPYEYDGSIPSQPFSNNYSLQEIRLPQGITSLPSYFFGNCYSLIYLNVPKSVTSIRSYSFDNCYSLVRLNFSNHEVVPTLEKSNTFNSLSSKAKIIVPDALYDEWIAATNWSSITSKIIKKSDWDAQNL